MRTLGEAARWYDAWLREAALPLWAGAGVDPANGLFQEALSTDGAPHEAPRRLRAQARQVFVLASAANAGYGARWLAIARAGYARLSELYRRPDGLFIYLVSADGQPLDETIGVYEQAFALLAMAGLHAADPAGEALPREARRTLDAMGERHVGAGGYRESGPQPYQANCHMHLLESALAWEETGVTGWAAVSDELAELALTRFIDPATGVLREFFDSDWRPLSGEAGLIEPGHHFEWGWLLERWGRSRGDSRARTTARRLFDNGLLGVDLGREVAVNALWEDFSVRDGAARLWPQTEYLKAALIFDEPEHALRAARGLSRYLETPARGAWRDKLQPDGRFLDEPSPATSFYHLYLAVAALRQAAGRPAGGN